MNAFEVTRETLLQLARERDVTSLIHKTIGAQQLREMREAVLVIMIMIVIVIVTLIIDYICNKV